MPGSTSRNDPAGHAGVPEDARCSAVDASADLRSGSRLVPSTEGLISRASSRLSSERIRSGRLVARRARCVAGLLPHLVIAVTLDGQVVLRSNVSADVLRSFGEDLKNVADELEAPPKPGDTTH